MALSRRNSSDFACLGWKAEHDIPLTTQGPTTHRTHTHTRVYIYTYTYTYTYTYVSYIYSAFPRFNMATGQDYIPKVLREESVLACEAFPHSQADHHSTWSIVIYGNSEVLLYVNLLIMFRLVGWFNPQFCWPICSKVAHRDSNSGP